MNIIEQHQLEQQKRFKLQQEQAVAIMLAFDKDKKLTDYVFTPLQVEEASK